MPPPPFWNQGTGLPSAVEVWKPHIPVWNVQVPGVQSAFAKHCLPGVGPPVHRPPPLYSQTGLGLKVWGMRLNTERTGNHPPLFVWKLQGTLSPADGPVVEARIP